MNSNLERHQHFDEDTNALETTCQAGLTGLAMCFPWLGILSPLLSGAFKVRSNKVQAFWNQCIKDLDSKCELLTKQIKGLEEIQQNYVFSVLENILVKVSLEPDEDKLKYFRKAISSILSDLPLDKYKFSEANNFIEILNNLQASDLSILAYLYPRFNELQEMHSSHLPWWNDFGNLLGGTITENASKQGSLKLEKAGLIDIDYLPRSGAVTLHIRLNIQGKTFADFCLNDSNDKETKIKYPLYRYSLLINNSLNHEYYSFSNNCKEEHLPDYIMNSGDPELLNIEMRSVKIVGLQEMKFSFKRGYKNNDGWHMSIKENNESYNHHITAHEAVERDFLAIDN